MPAKMHMLYVKFPTWSDGLSSHFFPVVLHKDRSDKVSPTQRGSRLRVEEGVHRNHLGNMSDAPQSQPAAQRLPCNSGRGRGTLKAQASFRSHLLEAKPLYLLHQPDGTRSANWTLTRTLTRSRCIRENTCDLKAISSNRVNLLL